MNCPNCGRALHDNALICPYCGTEFDPQPMHYAEERIRRRKRKKARRTWFWISVSTVFLLALLMVLYPVFSRMLASPGSAISQKSASSSVMAESEASVLSKEASSPPPPSYAGQTASESSQRASAADETYSDASALYNPDISTQESESSETELGYYASRLGEAEQKIYRYMVSKLSEFETTLVFSDTDPELVSTAYDALRLDNPELFWLTGGYSWEQWTGPGGSTLTLTADTLMSPEEARQKAAVLNEVCAQLLSEASGMSDFEAALYFHDYLINTTTYDIAFYDNPELQPSESESGKAYGCLVSHKAVCAGYTSAYQLLLKKRGVECLYVMGFDPLQNISHSWNCVKLDGEFYYVDLTWDDPSSDDGTETLRHDYFGITTDELLETHELDTSHEVPLCTATVYDYYIVNGLYASSYDYEQAVSLLEYQLNETPLDVNPSELILKYASSEDCGLAVEDLIVNQNIFYITGASSISYSISENGRILHLYI
ncbi:MAG: zinc-ribbon domain-containing protein [Firmicutes bacterium]|nr:zinc-ribbon domain-containing protein [Bacillota bacterium]